MSDRPLTPAQPLGYAHGPLHTFADNSERAGRALSATWWLFLVSITSTVVTLAVNAWSWFSPGVDRVLEWNFADATGLLLLVGIVSTLLGIIGTVLWILSLVFYMIWQHRAYANGLAGHAPLRYSPGWSVGWWFIPVVNLVMIGRVLGDLWQNSGAADATGDCGLGRRIYLVFVMSFLLSLLVSAEFTITNEFGTWKPLAVIADLAYVPLLILHLVYIYLFLPLIRGVQEMQQPGSV